MQIPKLNNIPSIYNSEDTVYAHKFFEDVNNYIGYNIDASVGASVGAVTNEITSILYLLTSVDMTLVPQKAILNVYYENEGDYLENQVYMSSERMKDTQGLFINQETATHFEKYRFGKDDDIIFLEGAANVLKSSKAHFLKIFIKQDIKLLFVYTNKRLPPETLYKLKVLEYSILKDKYEIYNKESTQLIKALDNKSLDQFNTLYEAYLKSDAITKLKITLIKDAINSNSKDMLKDLEQHYLNTSQQILQYENKIAELSTNITTISEKISDLKNKQKKDEEAELLYKLLTKHPYIINYTISRDTIANNEAINLVYKAPLSYFSEHAIDKIKDNHTLEVQAIFNAILDRKYEIYCTTHLAFNTTTFQINVKNVYPIDDLLPQPHLHQYLCFGNHREAIATAAKTGNYILALEQITQAVMNMNFYDACVTGYLINKLRSEPNRKTWRNTETNEYVDTETILKEYSQRKGETNEETSND